MSDTTIRCGAKYELANGEYVTPCHLHDGHEGDHHGYCLGSVCTWRQGMTSEYDPPAEEPRR